MASDSPDMARSESAGRYRNSSARIATQNSCLQSQSEKRPRGHADFIDTGILMPFLRGIAPTTPRLDIMLEAKKKDEALFRLMEAIRRKGDYGIIPSLV